MSSAKKAFEEGTGKSRGEKKALYASLISAEDKIELYRLEKSKYFTNENALAETTITKSSPSGKYNLVITQYKTDPGYGNYSLGTVSNGDITIDTVQRNYKEFTYVFIEGHPNGHDYLVCGEDYQGQTIIELDTGKRKDWIPSMGGFCWTKIIPSPSKTLLLVDGCYWGCPFYSIIVDFSNPLNAPYDILTEDYTIEDFETWNDDDSCSIEIEYEIRKSDGKALFELSKKELEDLNEELEPGVNQDEIFGYDKKWILWKKP
jgi:hypothetical protein